MSPAGRGRALAARLAVSAVLALCTLLPAAPPASACAVSVGYKPSFSISDLTHRRSCSTATSATGSVVVALLALGALAAAGAAVVRRAERRTGTGPTDRTGSSEALTVYLDATGIVPVAAERDHEV